MSETAGRPRCDDVRVVLTIGQGAREVDQLVGSLKERGVTCLVDVRSAPYSRHKPEFSREPLWAALQRHDIAYVFMGDLLGGRPSGDTCYVDGKVDYEAMKSTEPFRRGVQRLRAAWEQGLQVCLLCSEGRPEQCHRSKLIAQVLEAEGIPVQHIDERGELRDHQAILRLLSGGQLTLFGETFGSRKRYRSGAP